MPSAKPSLYNCVFILRPVYPDVIEHLLDEDRQVYLRMRLYVFVIDGVNHNNLPLL